MPQAPVDLEQLKELYGPESIQELLEMSVMEAKKLVEQLAKSVPEHNRDAVSNDAHQLKGMAATMTLNHIAELSKQLEQCAKKDIWDDSNQILSVIRMHLEDLEQFLKSTFV